VLALVAKESSFELLVNGVSVAQRNGGLLTDANDRLLLGQGHLDTNDATTSRLPAGTAICEVIVSQETAGTDPVAAAKARSAQLMASYIP
jgi:hypothetical protein